jgi:hypothetical protein
MQSGNAQLSCNQNVIAILRSKMLDRISSILDDIHINVSLEFNTREVKI